MSDIALTWDVNAADFGIEDNDLVTDDGLETAVALSLFTDRRAEDGDVLPDLETDRRGWWADDATASPVVAGDRFGSRLWLLARSKDNADYRVRAVEYAREALQWLLDDKVASNVDVSMDVTDSGVRCLVVTISRPATDPVKFQFNDVWLGQGA